MIRPEMAKRLTDQITGYTDYNINIMDESGVIIASRDPGRVGTYHEAADRIIRGKDEIVVIEDDKTYPGVKPGINMAIMVDGKKEGVVGVTGSPDSIREVAMVTRLAIEAMLKYEKQQEKILLRQGRKENFFNLLTRVEDADPSELRAAARTLGYDESVIRVPILCRIFDDTPADRVLEAIRANRDHSIQDLSTVIDKNHVLVFHTLHEKRGGRISQLRHEVLSYMDRTVQRLDRSQLQASFYVGTPQSAFSQYIYAYRHCKWIESLHTELHTEVHTELHAGGKKGGHKTYIAPAETGADRVHFFYDYTGDYFYSVLPREELHRVFYQYTVQLKDEERIQFLEAAKALIDTNFNLTEAARQLYIHKNTMTYRYNKIKDMLDIDPIRRGADRTFLTLLYHSLTGNK